MRGRAQQSSRREEKTSAPVPTRGDREIRRASVQSRPCSHPRGHQPPVHTTPEAHLPPHEDHKPLSPRAAGALVRLSEASVPGGTQRRLWGRLVRSHSRASKKGGLVDSGISPGWRRRYCLRKLEEERKPVVLPLWRGPSPLSLPISRLR